jgi:hypothetical protein
VPVRVCRRRRRYDQGNRVKQHRHWRLQHRFSFWVKQCRPQEWIRILLLTLATAKSAQRVNHRILARLSGSPWVRYD